MATQSFSMGSLEVMLLVACLVAMASRRLNLPYTVGLLIAGFGLSMISETVELPLSRELIFKVFLPPLVFQAALEISWDQFRKNLPVTLLLACPGVLISAAVVAAGTHALLGWSWLGASFFGILIAATDPVAVIGTFKSLNANDRLKLLVESESLMNDGVAAVAFGVLMGISNGAAGSIPTIGGDLLVSVFGAIACGVVIAGGLLLIAGRTEDHLVEITLSTIAAYGSFLTAEYFGMSGVLASLTAGLVVGNVGWRGAISEAGRDHVDNFWTYAAFLANSVIFILIGGRETAQPIAFFSGSAAVCIVLVLIGRAVSVYPLSWTISRTALRIDPSFQHVLFWGGLRGAMALALALSLPASLAERQEITTVTFAVVGFSILAQGISMPWLVRRLGLVRGPAGRKRSADEAD